MKISAIIRPGLLAAAVLVFLVFAARAAMPHWVLNYVNREINRIPEYRGQIADVSIHLYRGAYQIHDLKLKKLSGKVPVPFFEAPLIDLSIQWRELLHGALVGTIELESPRLNFVQGERDEDSQVKIKPAWQDVAASLFPLRVNHFRVKDGQIHFRNFHTEPQVDPYIDRIEMAASNLTNSRKISKSMVAHIDATGRAQSEATLWVRADLDPFSKAPTFALAGSLEHLDLTRLNNFFEGYLAVDVQAGDFSLFTEMDASKGNFEGYIKPIMKNFEILSLKEDVNNPFRLIWETIIASVAQVFTNIRHDELATKIYLSGQFEKPELDYWNAFGWLLYNAFIKALSPSLEPVKGSPESENPG